MCESLFPSFVEVVLIPKDAKKITKSKPTKNSTTLGISVLRQEIEGDFLFKHQLCV